MSQLWITVAPAWGITYADDTTPTNNWKPYYGNYKGDFSTVYNFPFPGRGPTLKRENGNYVGVTGYRNPNDHHTVIVRRSDCEIFETYNDRLNGETNTCQDRTTTGCNVSSINIPYGFGSSGVDNGPYGMPHGSTDAAGLPLAPLSWHLDEVKSGSIKHAARFTASAGYINGFIWPASSGFAAAPLAPPYGARFVLKTQANGGPNVTAACTPSGGTVNADCVTMLTALQQYGMILADIGLNNEIQSFTDLSEDATARAAINLIQSARIPMSDFYAVDESSLEQTSADNYVTFDNGTYSVDPMNGYVNPDSSAIVTASQPGGSTISTPIALQGTAVGVNSNELTISAGMSGYQIASWVNPSNVNQAVTWTKVSGVGTLTAGGVYTPPSDTLSGDNAVLKVTAVADSAASTYVYVKVLSTNNSPSAGTIRIDSASEVNTTDGYGYVWNSESGMEASLPTESGLDWPLWTGNEGTQYGTQLYTRGGDIAYRLVVPNGNYKVRLMYGQILNGAPATKAPYAQSLISSPLLVESQGVIAAHYFDWDAAAGYHYQVPVDLYVPARVTDNTLVVRSMVTTPDTPITAASGLAPLYPGQFPYLVTTADVKSSEIEGIEFIPDSAAPHWAIDAQGAVEIKPGQNIQLYNVDWYTGVNDPTWSIVSGPSGTSISSSGLLTLPANATPEPVVVMASDGQYSATLLIPTPGSSKPKSTPTSNVYSYVRSLTITPNEVQPGGESNFPLTIRFSDPSIRDVQDGGHVMNPNGYDMILAADSKGKNVLDWEVESYDGVNGVWVAHVKIPALSKTAKTVIYLLYGNGSVTTPMSNPSAVWDTYYQGVYHFNEASSLVRDSTPHLRNGSAAGLTFISGGIIGGASNADGGSATLPDKLLLNSTTGTIELWVNISTPEDNTHNALLLQQDWFDGSPDGFSMGWSAYWNDFEVAWMVGSKVSKLSVSALQMPLGRNKWNHIAYTWNRNLQRQSLYLNGSLVVSNNRWFGNPAFTNSPSFSVPMNPSYYGISGLMDEIRFSSIERNPGWIATEYANQKPGSRFITFGAEEPFQ